MRIKRVVQLFSLFIVIFLYACGGPIFGGGSNTDGDPNPPTAPGGVSATAVSDSEITVLWSAATDDTGVAGYSVSRSDGEIVNTTALTYSDTGLLANTTYCYVVQAYDAADNFSLYSAQACATTQAP